MDFDFETFAHVNRSRQWRLAPGWELRGRVDDLADEDDETLIGFPGPGRALRLGLRHRFGGGGRPAEEPVP